MAALCQVGKIACASRAWRHAINAAYPDAPVSYSMTFGAVCAGGAVGSIIPAHSGDALRVVIAKRNIPDTSYATLAATLFVLIPFDTLVALVLFFVLLIAGVFPGHSVVSMPAFDLSWFFGHIKQALIIAGTILALLAAFVLWAWASILDFREHFRQGLNGICDWRYYLRHVVPWQAGDWGLRIVTLLFALLAFHMPGTLRNAVYAQGTSSLSTLLPISPSGIGTEQALLTSVLGKSVPDTSLIVAYSVGTRLMLILLNLALGFGAIFLFFGTVRYRSFVEAEKEEDKGGGG